MEIVGNRLAGRGGGWNPMILRDGVFGTHSPPCATVDRQRGAIVTATEDLVVVVVVVFATVRTTRTHLRRSTTTMTSRPPRASDWTVTIGGDEG